MQDRIELMDTTVDCIVGLLADEQRRTQPVEVSLVITMDLEPVSKGDLTQGFDYAAVQEQVCFLLHYGQWRLIESAAMAIARLVLAPAAPAEVRGQAEEATVTLRKPTILDSGVPGVVVQRDALWCDLETRMGAPKLWVDVLVETPRTGAYRIHMEPEGSWKLPPGAAFYVLGGSLKGDGEPIANRTVIARGAVQELVNAGSEPASLLLVTSPRLDD